MKKLLVFLCAMLWFAVGISTVALGAPMQGTWNGTTTGLGDEFDGIIAVLDPENNGGEIGDEAVARDSSSSSYPGYAHYWSMYGMIRVSEDIGDFTDNDDGTGTQEYSVTRSGGTFTIKGDNLWGHDPNTIYTASIQGESTTTVYYSRNDDQDPWQFDYIEGEVHYRGLFNEDPYLFDFTADVYIDYYGYNGDLGYNIFLGELSNVEMNINPIPEPATMLLLGSGLIGLAGFGRKRFKK